MTTVLGDGMAHEEYRADHRERPEPEGDEQQDHATISTRQVPPSFATAKATTPNLLQARANSLA